MAFQDRWGFRGRRVSTADRDLKGMKPFRNDFLLVNAMRTSHVVDPHIIKKANILIALLAFLALMVLLELWGQLVLKGTCFQSSVSDFVANVGIFNSQRGVPGRRGCQGRRGAQSAWGLPQFRGPYLGQEKQEVEGYGCQESGSCGSHLQCLGCHSCHHGLP